MLFQHCCYSLLIEPKKNLVQRDSDTFYFAVKPKLGCEILKIRWELTALNFNCEGECHLNVRPIIEDEVKTIWVSKEEDIKPDEIEIAPKTVTK